MDMAALIKIIIFLLAWLILWLPIAIGLGSRLGWQPLQGTKPDQKLPLVASLYALAPLVIWGLLKIEGSSLHNYGLIWSFSLFISLTKGLILAVVGLGIIFFLEGILTWVHWQPKNLTRAFALSFPLLIVALWVGITEELIFRGIFLSQLSQEYGFWLAGAISSLIFALLHLLWERQQTLPQLPGLFLMGMVLVWARAIDHGSLGLAWGLHSGWVWGLALLDSAELMSYSDSGLVWVKGIYNQPLAGLAGILCLLGTAWGLNLFQ
ncbi:MAG: CPBP family intramembrane metalloprotease [Microcystis aeruginosa Ma_SC_T_19800800_S464]|jgi:membrane protease YdiL (CAAX protease family)|uniref:CPBP family intramembrane metalloprotease n=1 Tax=Microcystis aeruginosa Ma_SC_T_19800800_S464 TaxID=2486257 RepID=A0A552DLI2_MICAE|nr:MAG: CPBP family intramembrane metalloprotease [Microcystis aeruginosa Ma_SC_T_19800800_S464]